MKKGIIIQGIIYSGMMLLTLILSIVGVIMLLNNSFSLAQTLSIIGNVLTMVCVIGVFVISIVTLVKARCLSSKKGFAKATGIVGIVFGSLGILLVWISLAVVVPALPFIAEVGILVTFGFYIALFILLNKANEFTK